MFEASDLTDGRAANLRGSGASYPCVAPPVKRTSLRSSTGTLGNCDGTLSLDLNALIAAQPAKAPPPASTVQMPCWFRAPSNTSNPTTSMSGAPEFRLRP